MCSFCASFLYGYFTFSLHFISWSIIESAVWQTVRVLLLSILPDSLYCMHVSDLTHCIVSPPSAPVKPIHVWLPLFLHLHCPHPSLCPKPPTSLSLLPHPWNLTLISPIIMSTFSSLQPSTIPSLVHCGCAVCVTPTHHFLHRHCSLQSPSW